MMSNIRRPQVGDLNYLVDIDLKCFEDNISLDEWRLFFDDTSYKMLVWIIQGIPVGFIIWQENTIVRMAVKPVYRHRGIGAQLLSFVENRLVQQRHQTVMTNIPESLCCPGKPVDVSGWLSKRGYQAESLQKDAAMFCGCTEDLVHFNKNLSKRRTTTHG